MGTARLHPVTTLCSSVTTARNELDDTFDFPVRPSPPNPKRIPTHPKTMRLSVTTTLLVVMSIVTAQELCDSRVSEPIVATLDNSLLFSTCATAEIGVQTRVSSLFDVLQFAARDFLLFCRASSCLSPVRDLVDSIPPNCLIRYHGSPHNLSQEVSALHDECIETTDAANQAAEDDMSRYFLDI